MKKILISVIAAATMMVTSCGLAEKAAEFGSPSMNSKSTYESLAKQVSEFDKGWKPFRLLVTNKGVNDECSNELSLAQVYMVNAENEKISQTVLPKLGDPKPLDGYKDINYDELTPLDLSAATLLKNIDDCKAMIPEGFKFLNLEDYLITYEPRDKGYEAVLEINVQEIGKEKVEANGKSSEVYYQLKFRIAPDGSISIEDN